MQTGDKVLGKRFNCDIWEEFIFLYYRKDGNPVVTREHDWNTCSSCSYSFCVQYIKPLPVYEERILDPVRIMKWLVAHDYCVDSYGDFYKMGGYPFFGNMWQYCGKKKPENWYPLHSEWIEKVEI